MTVAKIQWLKINRGAVGEEIHQHAAIVEALNSSVGRVDRQSVDANKDPPFRAALRGQGSFKFF